MAKTPNKPKTIQRFIALYLKNFEKPNAPSLLLNLIVDGIVDPERLRNYMIIEDYHKNLCRYNGCVKDSILDIAEVYDLSDRQIQNIVYKWSKKFRVKTNIANINGLFSLDLN